MGIFIDKNTNKGVSNEKMVTKVTTVNNILEAKDTVNQLVIEGYNRESLYVIAHSNERAEHVAEHTLTNTIGLEEEGVLTAIANLFRSQGDELRAELRSMGISKQHAERLEQEMDRGKIVILAWDNIEYEGDDYNPLINYFFVDY